MPPEQPAIMEIVPVGAMVVTVALRTRSPRSLVARALEVGHDAALLGEGPALLPGLVVHELHHPLGEGEALVGVVGDAELDQEVGEAHDPEPDAPVAPAHPVDLVQRVVVLLDHVVQEADRGVYRLPQLVPVDLARLLYIEALQVDRTEVARVVRRQVRLASKGSSTRSGTAASGCRR